MKKIRSFISSLVIFLFPLFFLTTTQEFYSTNKFYLLGFGVLAILVLATIDLLSSKKLTWHSSPLDGPIVIFLIFYAVSIILVSPNKIEALINPVTGFGTFLFLGLLYFILKEEYHEKNVSHFNHLAILNLSAAVLGLISIFFFFNPFGKANLPQDWLFLKNQLFTPTGTQMDLVLFLGFFVVIGAFQLLKPKSQEGAEGQSALSMGAFVVIVIGFLLSAYTLFKPFPTQNQTGQGPKTTSIYQSLPPFSVSWYSTLETLKNPKTALFGAGPDNFASIYTQSKTPAYNGTNLWNVNFTQSRSFLLQLWAETGILGLGTLLLILVTMTRIAWTTGNKWGVVYILAALLLFPPSLLVLFLLFILAALTSELVPAHREASHLDLSNPAPLYLATAVISFLLIGGMAFLLGRSYVAEYYFKRSFNGLVTNNAKEVYDNMRQAILLDPYIERFRINFSQLNMLIANNVASKAAPKKGETKPQELSEADRQTIAQAIQAAIAEAKAAVALNPNKAGNWENLALIYRNVLNAAQGADSWTVASYQRAIVLDPQNPIYRLNLGGVFYSLQNYEDATRLFEQAAALKPDWPNAHYNLAWASYQKQNYTRAVNEMQAVLDILQDKNSSDYKRAMAELETFKKKIPAQEATSSAKPKELNLPTPPAASIEPKLQLPKSASPEANPANVKPQ